MSLSTLPNNAILNGHIGKIATVVLLLIVYGLILKRYHLHCYMIIVSYSMAVLPWVYMFFFNKQRAWNFFPPLKSVLANRLGMINVYVITFLATLLFFLFLNPSDEDITFEYEFAQFVSFCFMTYLVFSYFMYFALLATENAKNKESVIYIIMDIIICSIFLYGNLTLNKFIENILQKD